MALTAAPYGLRPIKRADGLPYAGATTQYLIDPAGEATNIFNGQVVYIGADGYIAIVTGTGGNAGNQAFPVPNTFTGALGVFMGCEFVNAQGQLIFSQYYPSGTTGVVRAYVVDDPSVLFQVQLDGAADQSDIGANTAFAAAQSTTTGSTQTGNSTSAMDATTVTTTAAFRIVSTVSPITDAFPDVLVKFNIGYNSATNAVGL
jgi:hypothetical protein|tara:strand:- start:324 stop:932 length:609 start_codon:yes stop_codon:yes gene_type:complete